MTISHASLGLDWRALEADVVVVGAGPAGLAVASRAAAGRRRVLVLDSGGLDPAPDRDAGRAAVQGRLPYFDLVESRPRGLGGGTALWGGWCEPLGALDFRARPELGRSGWCLSPRDLEPYYGRARAFCGIPADPSFREWARDECLTGSAFVARSCPVAAPGDLGRRHAAMFDGGGADLVLGATVTRISTAPGGATVDHVVVGGPGHGATVHGNAFVLAAGGIETARLLLASASAAWPGGIGNSHDLVGRCFMEHPHADAMRLRGSARRLDLEFFMEHETSDATLDGAPLRAAGALVLSDEACRSAAVGGVELFIEPAGAHTQHPIPRRWRDRPLRLRRPVPGDDELAVIAVSEQVPNPCSRVVLGGATDRYGVPLPVLRWELTDVDQRTVHVGVELARELLVALGGRNVRRRMRRGTWPRDTLGGAHHLGTARMASAPAAGVVDGRCRVHGVDNLFIAGGAVFPTCGYAPPTLTIIALALRLGDHLAAGGAPSTAATIGPGGAPCRTR